MTGEISLVGQVLPVGGLKEKILAAHRAGIKTIIAPSANRADIEENVPESVKTGIRFASSILCHSRWEPDAKKKNE